MLQRCWEAQPSCGCAFRIFIYFCLTYFPCASFSMLIRGQHLKCSFSLYITQTTKHLLLKHPVPAVWNQHREVLCIWGEETSFASHFHCISISACVPTLTHSSASFATTCSNTFMFIHPSVSQTCNQITNLCTISTFKQVGTGNKMLWRQKQVRAWGKDYGRAQDKSAGWKT